MPEPLPPEPQLTPEIARWLRDLVDTSVLLHQLGITGKQIQAPPGINGFGLRLAAMLAEGMAAEPEPEGGWPPDLRLPCRSCGVVIWVAQPLEGQDIRCARCSS